MKVKSNRFLLPFDLIHFYLPFALIFAGLIYFFRYSPILQMQVATLCAIVYLLFALIHHFLNKTLTMEVIIEYVLLAGVSLIILSSVIA